ncbi:MAG: hypothetical protein K5648_05640 [Erysipelotrichaceae bacterium]|nr:hypothetical protein [Erysipelotrichaceae bacterium]
MKHKLYLLFALLLCLASCNRTGVFIDPDSEKAGISYKNVANENAETYQSANWEVKVASLTRIKKKDKNLYLYRLLLMPRYEDRIGLGSVEILPGDFIMNDYAVKTDQHYFVGYKTAGQMLDYGKDLQLMNGQDRPYAGYRFDFVFDNIENTQQEYRGITDEEFDEMMRDLKITISWNYFEKETISLHFDGEIGIAADEDSPIYKEDEEVRYLYDTDRTLTSAGYYEETLYPYTASPVENYMDDIRKTASEMLGKEKADPSKEYRLLSYLPIFVVEERGSNGTFYTNTFRDFYLIYDGEKIIGIILYDHSTGEIGPFENEEMKDLLNRTLLKGEPVRILEIKGTTYLAAPSGILTIMGENKETDDPAVTEFDDWASDWRFDHLDQLRISY